MRMSAADLHRETAGREDQLVELELDHCGVAVWSKS
jgi:hypothetical protein